MLETGFTDLHRLYGQLPPYLQLSAPAVKTILRAYDQAWALHYPEDQTKLEWNILERTLDGFWAIYFRQEEQCFITAMQPINGTTIRENVDWLLEQIYAIGGKTIIFGGVRDPFGLGWSGLSSCFTPLANVLAQHFNYQIEEQRIVYELRGLQTWDLPQVPALPSDCRFEFREDLHSGEWEVLMLHKQEQIGESEAWNVASYFEALLAGEHWRTIEWIGIKALFRRQGLGKTLLLRQLAWQKEKGIDKLVLWIEEENKAAQALVRRLGFDLVDTFINLIPQASE